MRVKIYQIDKDTQGVKFMDYDYTIKKNGKIHPDTYKEVFNADIDEADLEEIYRRFNTIQHPLFRGHSLSVSDVVATDNGAFFVDSIGFKQIVFDETKTHKPENLLKVVYIEPHRRAYEAEVLHEYAALSNAVGTGMIEHIYNGDDTLIVCNNEAKYFDMDNNRRLDNGTVIAGPFFVCGDNDVDYRSLTVEEVKKYLDRFGEPEDIG